MACRTIMIAKLRTPRSGRALESKEKYVALASDPLQDERSRT
jgi:hypothetical protein